MVRRDAMDCEGPSDPVAVIDIGSNSVRLVVYDRAVRAPTPIFNEKILAGLGRTVASTGRLADEAVERAVAALARFRAVTNLLGVNTVRAIATAACREAENGTAFIRRAEAAAGVKIDILSGAEEAALAAAGILMGCHEPDGFAGDLGGGSLELVDLARGQVGDAATLPLGGLRLIDSSGGRIDRAVELADAALDQVPWLSRGKERTFYAVGGTWRALAKLHMEATDYPLRVMHGYALPAKDALRFSEEVRRAKKVSTLPGARAIPKARREVLPYGAAALERVLRRIEPARVEFSVFGIREGLLHTMLVPAERAQDPLLAFAIDSARQRSRSVRHAQELCAWTDPLFATGPWLETANERRLRHAACLMSDVGWRAHPDYRGEQTLNLIAHAALAGIDHPGRMFLALAIYYRHDREDEPGQERLSERLRKILPPKLIKRAKVVGAAIRAAHMISIGRPGIIDAATIVVAGDTLRLTLPQEHAVLDGERLRRRLQDLAELLELKTAVVVNGAA